jgi:RND superfamily putative drug exporter
MPPMRLLGDANWYLPRWLEWLPGKPSERRAEPAPTPTSPTPTVPPVGRR